MQPTRIPVSSSAIAAVTPSASGLDIEFLSGALYRYPTVPSSLVDALLHADSKGAFFNRHIRPHFSFRRLT